jgi:hypothetical protein
MILRSAGPLVAASAVALAAYGVAPARTAFACSAGEDFNPVADSDVIVSGVILGWEETNLPGFPEDAHVKPIRVEMQVEDTLKGEASGRISFVDSGSLMNLPPTEDGYLWDGSGGACGAFNTEPTGEYVFLGLSYDDAGNLRSNLLRVFYIGERSQFAGFRYERMAEILGAFGLTRLPATGDGAMATPGAPDGELIAIATLLIALGVGGLSLLRRTA